MRKKRQKQIYGNKLVRQTCHQFAELMAEEIQGLVATHIVIAEFNNGKLQTFQEETMPPEEVEEYLRLRTNQVIEQMKNHLAAIARDSLSQDDKSRQLASVLK